MLASFRKSLNTWPARLLFMFLVVVFVAWGVGADILRLISGGMPSSSVATVGSRSIELPELQDAYRRQLAQVTRMLGNRGEPTPEMRRGVAAQALQRLIAQAALTLAAEQMGLTVPEEALRQATFQIPAFRGGNGQFDRTTFEQVLRSSNLTEARFLGLLRLDILQRQLLETLRSGAVSPDVLTREIYAFQQEKRGADTVELAFANAAPTAPTDIQLTRWYENHKDQYSTPELRRIKAVVLSPETVAKEVEVTDEDLRGAYEQAKASYNVPEKRSAEVVLLTDEAKARALAGQWLAGADWTAIQAEAAKQGGSPVDLDLSTRDQIPSPELAEAVFAALPDVVGPPVPTALGWYVLKVTKIASGTAKTFDEARDELRGRVLADKAADLIYDRANKIEDLLTGGVALDSLPGDLGLAAVTGTLDALGNTEAGQPAPIPGGEELRAAVIQAAFQTKKGDPVRLIQVPADGNARAFFAVAIEDIVPPAPRPMAEVADRVRADWTHDAIHHASEEKAAAILAAVKAGKTLADAAGGLPVQHLPPAGRGGTTAGVPPQLLTPLFALKPGEPTMTETADGFVVAVLREVQTADPAADPIGYGQVRDGMARAIATDMEEVFATAVREHAAPHVNRPVLERLVQQSE